MTRSRLPRAAARTAVEAQTREALNGLILAGYSTATQKRRAEGTFPQRLKAVASTVSQPQPTLPATPVADEQEQIVAQWHEPGRALARSENARHGSFQS